MSTPDLLTRLKPLRGAHWLLSLVIVASAMLLTFAGQCTDGLASWQAAWVTGVIATVFWTNHLRVAPVQRAKLLLMVVGRSAWELFKLVVVCAVVAIALASMTPTVSCQNDRTKIAMMLVDTSAQRAEIAERIFQRGNVAEVGQGMVFTPTNRAKAGSIQNDGSIVVISDDPPAALLLVPSIDASGEIQWTCKGVPEKAAPLSCRRASP